MLKPELFRALAALAASALFSLPAAAGPLRESIEKWDALAVETTSRNATALVLRSRNLQLTLQSGQVAKVTAGGEVVGLFLSGAGTLRHVSGDAVEHPAIRYVAKKNTGLDVTSGEGGLVLSGPFSEALWLASGTPLPEVPETPDAGDLTKAFAKHRERFGELAERPLAQQFTHARRNGPTTPFVRVEAGGGKDDLVYVLDELVARSESLSLAQTLPYMKDNGDDRKFLAVLSEVPIGRERRDPGRPEFVLTDVDLALTASDGTHAKMTVTETISAVAGSPSVLLLDLYDVIRRPKKLYGFEKKTVRLVGAFDEAGNALETDHRRSSLAVGLRTPLVSGRPIKVRFEIEGDLLHRPGGDSYWELGTEPWFPQPDMGGQYYTVRSAVKVKKPFLPLVPGKTVRRAEEGEYNVLETRIEKPVQFFVVFAGKYAWEEETKDGVTIRVASYAGENRIAFKKLLGLSRKAIEYFSGFLGPFPFEEFNIVEVNDWGYGQAPPAFMFITSEAFNSIGGEINQLYSEGVNGRVAHEIAHQWWGHVVKMPGYDEQWISESFAEYSAGLFIRDLMGKSDFARMKAGWRRQAGESHDIAPIPLANRVIARGDMSISWSHRTALLYSKGPLLLEALHRDLGDQRFLVFLASLQSTLPWKFGSTGVVQKVLDAVGKKDYGPFLDQYYWGLAVPPAK